MNFSRYYAEIIRQVYVQRGAERFPAAQRLRETLSDTPIHQVESETDIPAEHLNQQTIYLGLPKGESFRKCPGSKGHLCCNLYTLDLYEGCALACSYCIMRCYLNFAPVRINVDPSDQIGLIREQATRSPHRTLRVGTGETGDSLLYDPATGLSEQIIRGLHDLPNVHFEMKTKTPFVDHLLDIDTKGNAVIGFSLNPGRIVDAEEVGAASPEERIAAAGRAAASGYRVSFHFDPIFFSEGWSGPYRETVGLLATIPQSRIAWISLGTFRYPPALKDWIGPRRYLLEEFIPCADGKYRYIQKLRIAMYREMLDALRKVTDAPVYLCMESPTVWRQVFDDLPGRLPELIPIFGP